MNKFSNLETILASEVEDLIEENKRLRSFWEEVLAEKQEYRVSSILLQEVAKRQLGLK